ncbi:hypothetical protein D9M68_629430 [compost metagenome]
MCVDQCHVGHDTLVGCCDVLQGLHGQLGFSRHQLTDCQRGLLGGVIGIEFGGARKEGLRQLEFALDHVHLPRN